MMAALSPARRSFLTLLPVLGVLWLTLPALQAQEETYHLFNIQREFSPPQKGISSVMVSDIVQDGPGLIWIATPEGLDICDGVSITNYLPGPNNPIGAGPGVNCLDVNARFLFAGTEEGVLRVDLGSREPEGLLQGFSISTLLASGDTLFACTPTYVYVLGGAMEDGRPELLDSLPVAGCKQVLPYGDSWLMAGNSGLWLYGGGAGRRLGPDVLPDTIWCMGPLPGGRLALGSAEGLYLFDLRGQTAGRLLPSAYGLPRSADRILSIAVTGEGDLYAGTSGAGILKVDGDAPMLVPGTEGLFVFTLHLSRDATLWAGTAWNGLYRIDTPNRAFHRIPTGHTVWDFLKLPGDGAWLIAGDMGLIRVEDPEGLRVTDQSPTLDTPFGLRALLATSQGIVLMGGVGRELLTLDREGRVRTWMSLSPPTPGTGDFIVQDLIDDESGNTWVLTNAGLCRIGAGDRRQDWFFHDDDTLSTNFYSAAHGKEGVLLFGSHAGLIEYQPGKGAFRLITRRDGLTLNKVISVFEDATGHRWIGTLGGGLNIMSPRTGAVSYLTRQDGLADNVVTSIQAGSDGKVWISTNHGLSMLDTRDSSFITFSTENGLPGMELNIGASLLDGQGRLWLGGRNGFAVSDTARLFAGSRGPGLCVTELRISGSPAIYGIGVSREFVLRPGQNTISIDFISTSYHQPLLNRYTYQLLNYDQLPTEVGPYQSVVTYRRLPPGEYRFVLTAADYQGYRSSEPLVLSFRVLPPWYRQWWFRMLAIVLPLLLLIWTWRARLRRLERKHQLDMQIVEAEKQALRLQMNPHFIFNSLNAIQGFVVKGDTDEAVRYLAKFSHLMRMILNNSREAFIPVDDEILGLRHYLDIERLRFSNAFRYEIEVDERIDTEFTGIPPMLIQPYVENAILHGLLPLDRDGILRIEMVDDGDALVVSVSDNGIGRKAAEARREVSGLRHQPKGMLITRERLALLNRQYGSDAQVMVEDLADDQGRPAGTRVTIRIITKEL